MAEQPMPIPNDGPSIQDLVIEDMKGRKRLGVERYGVSLQAWNGRSAELDAYEEGLDLVCYLRQGIEERKELERRVVELYEENSRLAGELYDAKYRLARIEVDQRLAERDGA